MTPRRGLTEQQLYSFSDKSNLVGNKFMEEGMQTYPSEDRAEQLASDWANYQSDVYVLCV